MFYRDETVRNLKDAFIDAISLANKLGFKEYAEALDKTHGALQSGVSQPVHVIAISRREPATITARGAVGALLPGSAFAACQ